MSGVSDNVRLGLKKYREIIYSEINKRYPPVRILSEKKKRSKDNKSSANSRSKSKESHASDKLVKKTSVQNTPLCKVIKSPSRLFTGASTALDK